MKKFNRLAEVIAKKLANVNKGKFKRQEKMHATHELTRIASILGVSPWTCYRWWRNERCPGGVNEQRLPKLYNADPNIFYYYQ